MSAYTALPSDWRERRGDAYRTTRPVAWELGRLGSGLVYEVPAGTPFDVSVPRGLAWAFDPHDPRYLKAACLHDAMLAQGWARPTAAAAFAEALAASGVGPARRLAMFLATALWRWR